MHIKGKVCLGLSQMFNVHVHHSHYWVQEQFKRYSAYSTFLTDLTFGCFLKSHPCYSLDSFYFITANLLMNQRTESFTAQLNLTYSKFFCPYSTG